MMGPELMCRALAMADSNVSSDESGPTPKRKGEKNPDDTCADTATHGVTGLFGIAGHLIRYTTCSR